MRLYVRMQTTIKCVKALKLRANIITSARKVHLGSPIQRFCSLTLNAFSTWLTQYNIHTHNKSCWLQASGAARCESDR